MKIKVTLDHAIPALDKKAGDVVEYNENLLSVGDDGLAFYTSQLSHVENTVYEAKYPNINFDELLPLDASVPEWADTYDFISYDAVTIGKFIGSSADDLPNIEMFANKSSENIGYAGNEFSYGLDEMRKAARMRMPVSVIKPKIAFRGAREHQQKVVYFGDEKHKMTGLFNNANVAKDNSTVNWNTASGQEIVTDMNSLLIKCWIDSANVHLPNTLVLDSKRYAFISSKKMDSGTDTTVLQYFMKNNLFTTMTGKQLFIAPRLQAAGAGTSGADRMVAYELNPENMCYANPIPWRPLAPQPVGLKLNVPCEYSITGMILRFPFSMVYRDNATPVAN